VPGSAFGAEGYVRFSYGIREPELKAAVLQLNKYLKTRN
jgi:aspartate/methionine/tyrosine aminotransferase